LGLLAGLWLLAAPLVLLTAGRSGESLGHAAVRASPACVFGLLFLVGFWGLLRRRAYGRWVSLLCLALLVVGLGIGQLQELRSSEYETAAERAGALTAYAAIDGALLAVVLRLAFSRRVGRFLKRGSPGQREGAAPQAVPPDPAMASGAGFAGQPRR